jgi:hypothetical protein
MVSPDILLHRDVVKWYTENPEGVNKVGAWLSPLDSWDYSTMEDEDETQLESG